MELKIAFEDSGKILIISPPFGIKSRLTSSFIVSVPEPSRGLLFWSTTYNGNTSSTCPLRFVNKTLKSCIPKPDVDASSEKTGPSSKINLKYPLSELRLLF